jgi:hypothetical protein
MGFDVSIFSQDELDSDTRAGAVVSNVIEGDGEVTIRGGTRLCEGEGRRRERRRRDAQG